MKIRIPVTGVKTALEKINAQDYAKSARLINSSTEKPANLVVLAECGTARNAPSAPEAIFSTKGAEDAQNVRKDSSTARTAKDVKDVQEIVQTAMQMVIARLGSNAREGSTTARHKSGVSTADVNRDNTLKVLCRVVVVVGMPAIVALTAKPA